MENKLLQELAKIGDYNEEHLMIVVRRLPDKQFIDTFGDKTARIDLVVPESLMKLFGDKLKELL